MKRQNIKTHPASLLKTLKHVQMEDQDHLKPKICLKHFLQIAVKYGNPLKYETFL